MKYALLALAATLLALAVSACGGTSLAKVATTPQAKKAEARMQSCASKSNFLTKSGRQGFVACFAPPGQKVAVEKCAQNALAHGKYFTKGERTAVETNLINCAVTK